MHNVCMFIMHEFYMMNDELKNYTEEAKKAVVPTNDFVFKRNRKVPYKVENIGNRNK